MNVFCYTEVNYRKYNLWPTENSPIFLDIFFLKTISCFHNFPRSFTKYLKCCKFWTVEVNEINWLQRPSGKKQPIRLQRIGTPWLAEAGWISIIVRKAPSCLCRTSYEPLNSSDRGERNEKQYNFFFFFEILKLL